MAILAALDPGFRREIVEAASRIIERVEPKTPERIRGLVDLTLGEARAETNKAKADIAYALAAELHRRTRE